MTEEQKTALETGITIMKKPSNIFWYTRKEKVQKPQVNGEEQPEEFKDYLDSFNLDYVIRSLEFANGTRVVILDDFHEEKREVPIFNKQKQFTGVKNELVTVCSEITLTEEDSKRYVELTK